MKRNYVFPILLALSLLLAACSSAGSQSGTPEGTGLPGYSFTGVPNTGGSTLGAPTEMSTAMSTSAATMLPSPQAPAPTILATTPAANPNTPVPGFSGGATGTPSSGSNGIPSTGNGQLVNLSNMLKFKVVDSTGTEIGTLRDLVVNMCEAHILYLVVDPSASLATQSGSQILIPYEAISAAANKGTVDAANATFKLNANASDLSGAPTYNASTLNLTAPDWDATNMAFWKSRFTLALTAGCNIPNNSGTPSPSFSGTPVFGLNSTAVAGGISPTYQVTKTSNRQTVYKIALASKLLNANLQTGNGAALGVVRDVAIIPNTGGIMYVVVQETASNQLSGQGGGRLVALPPGAVNVRYDDATGQGQPVIVLLAQTSVLQGAPSFNGNTGSADQNWFNYWNQFIPMTQSELP